MSSRSITSASAALALLLCGTASHAAFTVTAVLNGAPVNGRQRVDLLAFNDGTGGTGTKLVAVEWHYYSPNTKVYFGLQDLLPTDDDDNPVPDGVYDTVNLYNSPASQPQTSQLRISSAPGAVAPLNPAVSDHLYINFSPSIQPNAAGTPYAGGLSTFSATYVLQGGPSPVANGTAGGAATGASFGRLYIDAGGSFSINGNIAGDEGVDQPFTASIGGVPVDSHFVTVISPVPQTIVFGKNVSNGLSFSANITASDLDKSDILSLKIGTLPPGVSGVTFGPGGPPNFPTFTVVGKVAYSTNLTTVTIPFTVENGVGGSYPGSIVLNVVPEPVNALIALSACAIRRRRR